VRLSRFGQAFYFARACMRVRIVVVVASRDGHHAAATDAPRGRRAMLSGALLAAGV
jgi:hypothetical protein